MKELILYKKHPKTKAAKQICIRCLSSIIKKRETNYLLKICKACLRENPLPPDSPLPVPPTPRVQLPIIERSLREEVELSKRTWRGASPSDPLLKLINLMLKKCRASRRKRLRLYRSYYINSGFLKKGNLTRINNWRIESGINEYGRLFNRRKSKTKTVVAAPIETEKSIYTGIIRHAHES